MTHVFPRNSKSPPPMVARGEGAYLYDPAGKAYLNCGDAAVSCLGHSDPHVTAAIKAQLDQVAFAHTGYFTSDPAERLADRLVAAAPDGLDRVYFVSGGSEAMEAALKLARQYFIEVGQPERHRVIARRQSYHGNTLGALATGGNAARRAPFAPMLMDVSHVSPCYAYRDQNDGETDAQYVDRLITELEHDIHDKGAETIMAFVAEPVVGATLGAVPPVGDYFRRVRQVCDAHGILLIFDEVMCGMGRTGTLFAAAQYGVRPDMCAIAKGLGAGYQPIGAMMCSAAIHDTIRDGSGFFQHGHTYLGHPVACAAALAVVERLLDDAVLDRVQPLGAALHAALTDRFGQHPHVGDIRGAGLFRAIELVQSRETKAPFPRSDKVHARLKTAAFEAGLICYPMGGTVDGTDGDHVLLAPPFILEPRDIDVLVDRLDIALRRVLN